MLVRDPLGRLAPAAFFATDQTTSPLHLLAWAMQRWAIVVPFAEVRVHVGFECQRQGSPNAILRTSPALLGLFSFVTLLAHPLSPNQPFPLRTAAWYHNTQPPFSDAIAFVRHYLSLNIKFPNSPAQTRPVACPVSGVQRLFDPLCYAACYGYSPGMSESATFASRCRYCWGESMFCYLNCTFFIMGWNVEG